MIRKVIIECSQTRRVSTAPNISILNINANTNVKPFESIPGPKPLPLIGNTWRFFTENFRKNNQAFHKSLHENYGDICLLRNVRGRNIVFIYCPKLVEKIHRNEGTWPIREGFKGMHHYRNVTRKEIFKGMGLVNMHGEDWYKLRSLVNPVLMKPRTVQLYTSAMDLVAQDFIARMKYLMTKSKEMPEDFEDEVNKWAMESTGILAVDQRLGCLDQNPKEEIQKLIHSIREIFKLMLTIDATPYGHYCIKYNLPPWRKFVEYEDYKTKIFSKYIEQAHEKLDENKPENEKSAFEKLLKIDKHIATVMTMDIMFAGTDTTGKTTSSILYLLARHQNVQNALRDELMKVLPSTDTPITNDILSNLPYLKAVVRETFRLAPAGLATLRKTTKDVVLGGYQIPAGVNVLYSIVYMSSMDKQFLRPKEFIPERWLKTTEGKMLYKSVHPFVSLPFGFGPRSCIGSRVAKLEIEILVAKVIRNFKLEWPHDDMIFGNEFLYGIKGPLKLHVTKL